MTASPRPQPQVDNEEAGRREREAAGRAEPEAEAAERAAAVAELEDR
jgi:hypothetical protein